MLTITATLNSHTATATAGNPTVAFTTPQNYATRLSNLLSLKTLNPLWCPITTTLSTPQNLISHLSPHPLSSISAVLLPSRAAFSAFSTAVLSLPTPLLPPSHAFLTIGCLGKDAEMINSAFLNQISSNFDKIRVLVPPIATPISLVESLGDGGGGGRRALCLVPKVVGLDEPPVVPDFLPQLEAAGWVPVRVDAYETRWMGPTCAEAIVKEGYLRGLVFTSSAEVEGLLKSLSEFGWDWMTARRRWPELVVAAHGPVTAAGAERLGVDVDVVSDRFSSFDGVVDALCGRL